MFSISEEFVAIKRNYAQLWSLRFRLSSPMWFLPRLFFQGQCHSRAVREARTVSCIDHTNDFPNQESPCMTLFTVYTKLTYTTVHWKTLKHIVHMCMMIGLKHILLLQRENVCLFSFLSSWSFFVRCLCAFAIQNEVDICQLWYKFFLANDYNLQ